MEEYIDIVDENGEFTGEVLEKEEAHRLGKWHVTSHVWIFNSKGEVLFQKRSLTKSTFPGLWDISVAGHISTGETPLQGAYREVLEEIGLDVDVNDLEKVFVFKESHYHENIDWYNNEFHHVFLYRYDGNLDMLELQEEEVDDVRFLSLENFRSELRDPIKNKNFVSNDDYYEKIIAVVSDRVK
jgi:isopentenyldiphosphate isomerase